MSFDFNYKFWIDTKKDVEDIVKRQNVLKKKSPITNPLVTYRIFSELYVLYVELVNKLSYVYNYTFQVQKREVVRSLVQSAARRLIELKNELKNLELSEYVYTDKALIARKLNPYDLVIWRSPQFLYRRPPEIQNIVYERRIFMTEDEKIDAEIKSKIFLGGAVTLIQAHERARSARVYKSAVKYDKNKLKVIQRKKPNYTFTHKFDQPMSIPVKRTMFSGNFVKQNEDCQYLLQADNLVRKLENEIDEDEFNRLRNEAALKIQLAWRAHRSKKILKKRHIFKQTLYGMRTKKKLIKTNQYFDSVLETYKNELYKKRLDEDFIRLMSDERTRLLQERSPWIMEDISDHIRGWFREFYDKVGDFHPYPDALKSGTVLVLIDETFTPEEFKEKLNEMNLSKEEKKKRAEKAKQQRKKEKDKIRKEKIKEAKRRKKMKEAGIYDIADNLKTNKNIINIEKTIKQYSIDWKLIDEYLNKNHEAIKEWVTEGELAILHRELRALVDEYMCLEYEMLRNALCMDLKKKYKPQRKKKVKSKKKGKKQKKIKDITADRSLESLYEELKATGIIEKCEKKTFEAFISDFNFIADDTRDEDNLTTLGPAKADIKMVVQECMLGLGEFAVDKPKSLCLAGPLNNGKKLLSQIIAFETDAVFMNLSPEKTQAFGNKDLNYLMHVIMKVAKAFQPTIIFIQDVHRIFWKKVPKDQEYLNPRLLQKAISTKILKPIKKEDKILLLGTTDAPWSAKPKMKRIFQKVLLIPKCDYGTSLLLWLELLTNFAGEDSVDDYVYSALAKVLQNYNSGDITDNVAETLNVRRRMKLKSAPLNPFEFIEHFIGRNPPIFPPEEKLLEKFLKWYQRANKLCIVRRKFLKKKEQKNQKRR
ncbi:IQ and AAA domain-containing protein 1-like [Anastrepha obliqua]|uniref:IQ and AAA domain-containing protein 1-like n=1 Tax=Anastrepha obliqua TaxID=95512 RepID=UPI00240A5A00|nr:IQ and AAA domain-containing protein 1-like [Anastrepha obliqua]XP_054731930.1 IQ and AAA domain-containing protein 1-like [Anastrepha obliqua]XP_054731932.1 IQ and AAA domain-containing protein 1-like [Anastrepha obliqua]XP_054731933.1 IQ and AAA domain-containing protein 1-like [Anastrepha obliqua]XP_054731934.1 IQ and AAA domain-containing protein 1-like [Anastrepha obliqua]XP_054731935.1 IQ and AAA domain-containing protein 1-like [Anastrepha obliqua]